MDKSRNITEILFSAHLSILSLALNHRTVYQGPAGYLSLLLKWVWFVTETAPVIFITALPKGFKPGTITFNNSIAFVIDRICVYMIRNACSFIQFKTCEHSIGTLTLLLPLSHCGPSLSQGSSMIKCTRKAELLHQNMLSLNSVWRFQSDK